MRIEIARAIADAAAEIGVEIELRANYSGRGMMGRTTAALTYNGLSDLLGAVATASANVTSGLVGHSDRVPDITNGYDFVEGLAGLRTDNMGRDTIVY